MLAFCSCSLVDGYVSYVSAHPEVINLEFDQHSFDCRRVFCWDTVNPIYIHLGQMYVIQWTIIFSVDYALFRRHGGWIQSNPLPMLYVALQQVYKNKQKKLVLCDYNSCLGRLDSLFRGKNMVTLSIYYYGFYIFSYINFRASLCLPFNCYI